MQCDVNVWPSSQRSQNSQRFIQHKDICVDYKFGQAYFGSQIDLMSSMIFISVVDFRNRINACRTTSLDPDQQDSNKHVKRLNGKSKYSVGHSRSVETVGVQKEMT
jgi:hypothetical protein